MEKNIDSMASYSFGDLVKEQYYGYEGIVGKVFQNWEDLITKSTFCTITPDSWLSAQERSYTEEDLQTPWYTIYVFGGGSSWVPEKYLELIDKSGNRDSD
jgi:hypothetical protein